jgi:hypothetical protein
MKRIAKAVALFLTAALAVSTANAQNGKGHGNKRGKNKVVVYHNNPIVYPNKTVRVLPNGKVKSVPPGWSKGKKVGWSKGKGNKH